MSAVREILAAILLVGGASVVALAALGIARLPDPFSRMHAAAKAGVAGAGLLLLGAGLGFGTTGAILTAVAAVAFLVLTAPIASHALGRAAYVAGAPLGTASLADALSGVLDRGVFDIDPARTVRSRTPRAPSTEETAMSGTPEFRWPADPPPRGGAATFSDGGAATFSGGGAADFSTGGAANLPRGGAAKVPRGRPGVEAAALRRILVCLVGGPAQRAAAAEAMRLAGPAGAVVTGLSGAGLEPRSWRGPLPVGGAYWAEWLASRSRARMREAAVTALGEFEAAAVAHPGVRTAARHEEGPAQEIAALLAGQDLIVVPAGVGPHGSESDPGHEIAATVARARVAPVLRVRRRPADVRGVLLVVSSSPACGSLAASLLRMGLWPAAPISILPVADHRRGVREMVEAQAELLREHGRRLAVMAPIDLDFEADDLRARLSFFDAAVVPCLSARYGGFLDSVRNCAFETTAETVPLILLP